MQDLKELNEVITAIKEEIRQGADALTRFRKSTQAWMEPRLLSPSLRSVWQLS